LLWATRRKQPSTMPPWSEQRRTRMAS